MLININFIILSVILVSSVVFLFFFSIFQLIFINNLCGGFIIDLIHEFSAFCIHHCVCGRLETNRCLGLFRYSWNWSIILLFCNLLNWRMLSIWSGWRRFLISWCYRSSFRLFNLFVMLNSILLFLNFFINWINSIFCFIRNITGSFRIVLKMSFLFLFLDIRLWIILKLFSLL